MESASCERASYVSDFQKDTSGFTVIQGPAARIRPSRLPQDYSSCEFLFKNTRIPLFPDLYHYSVLLCRRLACLTWYCVSFFSWLWGPGEELVGMRNIPDRTLVFIRRMKDYLLAWKVKQSHSLSVVCWFPLSVSILKCRTVDQPMRPYLKENLPKRMHFAKNIRIERGHLYMKSGWQAAL